MEPHTCTLCVSHTKKYTRIQLRLRAPALAIVSISVLEGAAALSPSLEKKFGPGNGIVHTTSCLPHLLIQV